MIPIEHQTVKTLIRLLLENKKDQTLENMYFVKMMPIDQQTRVV